MADAEVDDVPLPKTIFVMARDFCVNMSAFEPGRKGCCMPGKLPIQQELDGVKLRCVVAGLIGFDA